MKLLLCVNDTSLSRPVLAYGTWLAAHVKAEVVVLGVVPSRALRSEVGRLADETCRRLENSGIACQRLMVEGPAEKIIATQAAQDDYLTLVGPLGTPLWSRLLRGRSIRRLLEAIESPLLYVPAARSGLTRMLICLGGIGRAANMVHMAKQLTAGTQAQVTLLHVVEPASFEYPITDALHDDWQTILGTDTPQSRHLQAALDELREASVPAKLLVRQGYVVHEILKEMRQGDYDLVGLGSHYSAAGLRPLFAPDVTGEVTSAARRPVLIVR